MLPFPYLEKPEIQPGTFTLMELLAGRSDQEIQHCARQALQGREEAPFMDLDPMA